MNVCMSVKNDEFGRTICLNDPPRSKHFLYNKRGAAMDWECQCKVDVALIKSHFNNGHLHFFMDTSIELNRIYTNDMQHTCVPIEQ